MPKIFKDKNDNVLYTGYETSEVVANPTLAGTETELTGIQIGSTKYKAPEGFSGNYNDLTNKPTIPAAVSGSLDSSSLYYWRSISIGSVNGLIPEVVTGNYDSVSPYWKSISIGDVTRNIPPAVSGTNDGTNWTSITIGDTTKAIPQGGGGSLYLVSFSFSFVDTGCSTHYLYFNVNMSSVSGLPASGTQYDYQTETSNFNSVMQFLANKFSLNCLHIPCFCEVINGSDNDRSFIIEDFEIDNSNTYYLIQILEGFGSGSTATWITCEANDDDTSADWHSITVQVDYVQV